MGGRVPRREKCNVHTLNKGSQTALITRLSVSLCLNFSGTRLLKNTPTRDASPPLVLAFFHSNQYCIREASKVSRSVMAFCTSAF